MTCAPNGRYVLSTWGGYPEDRMGPHRWSVSLAFRDRDVRPRWIRQDIPGSDRVLVGTRGKSMSDYPRTWGRRVDERGVERVGLYELMTGEVP